MSRVNPRLVYWIAAVHQHPQLTAAHRDVLTYLAVQRLDYATGRGYCSEESLAQGRGCSVATVRRALTIAREVAPKLLERTRRGHRLGNGHSAASEWRLIYPPISTAQGGTVEECSTAHGSTVEDISTAQKNDLNRSEGPSQPLTGERPTEPLSETLLTVLPLRSHTRAGNREGGEFSPTAKEFEALVEEAHTTAARGHKDWLRTDIREALNKDQVREHGWQLARVALLIIAADRDTYSPRRLAAPGPWWAQASAQLASDGIPEWCGHCRASNHRFTGDENRPQRCPECHPLEVRKAAS